jgi:hypothetical protein
MSRFFSRRRVTLGILITAVTCAGLLAIYHVFFAPGGNPQVAMIPPTCEIRFRDAAERLRREPVIPPSPGDVAIAADDPPFSADQVDNPVLLTHHIAKVRFENVTGHDLTLYAIKATRGEVASVARDALIVDTEVRDEGGNVVKVTDLLLAGGGWEVPPASEVLTKHPPVVTLRAGEGVDLPMSLLGGLHTYKALVNVKPGTYTVRAIVSYAEAPSGETRRVTSEPVTVTVTAEHIKAAEAYWAALKAAQN